MNNPVTLFVIPFLLVQVHSATIPVNVGQNGGEGLQDLSSRLYLADHPYFENTIVGATMKKNLKKLCVQCRHSPLCQGGDDCEHCAKYCDAFGVDTGGNPVAASLGERVGIVREPENDFMRYEDQKDTTLVSRFADGATGMEQGEVVQMAHEPMTEEVVLKDQREHEKHRVEIMNQKHQRSRYYTAGVIKPGLLMNIMLKLINIKQTNDIERVVILVKSKKSVPATVGIGEENETEFLKMLGKELETAEKIHGESPLDSKDINKILETAYEKGEFKSKSEAQIVSEADTLPIFHNEKITRFHDKIEHNTDKFEPASELVEVMMDKDKEDHRIDAAKSKQTETNMNLRNDDQIMKSQSIPEEMGVLGSSKDSEIQRQDATKENSESKLERENPIDMDSDSDESVEENDKARTLHKKKYKKKQKMHHMHSYGHSYGSNYNVPHGYYRSNDDESNDFEQQAAPQMDQQGTLESITGTQQESLRPFNEDHIGAKEDWQRDQKGFQYKGQGGQLEDLEKSHKTRNNEELIGAQQEGLRPLNEDRIGAKEDWQRDQKGFLYKGQGGQLEDLEQSHKTRNNEVLIGAQQEGLRPLNEDRIGAKEDWQRDQKGFQYKGQGDQLEELDKSHKTRNNEELIGAQQEGLRPLNEDRIGAKEDWQRDQKGFQYKGQGDQLEDLEKSHKTRNNEELIGAQQEGLRPLNEDRIGAKEDWQRDQKGFLYKGQGGQLEDLEKSHKTRNNEEFIGAQQGGLRPLNEDRIGIKENWQRDQKGYIFKGEGGLLRDLENYQKTINNEDTENDWQMDQKESIKGQKSSLKNLSRSQKTINDATLIDEHPEGQKLDEHAMDVNENSHMNSERRAGDEGIAKIILSEKNKELDPKKVQIAEPSEDNHDGMADPFHTRIHAHFNKVQEYFNKKAGKSAGKSESIVGMTKSTNKEDTKEVSRSGVMMQTRNNEKDSDSANGNQMNIETANLQMENNLEANEEMVDDMPKVGINFQPEDLINLQMANEKGMEEEATDGSPKVGINIQPQDIIILQKKNENSKQEGGNMNLEESTDLTQANIDTSKVKAAEPINNIFVTDDLSDLDNQNNRPQFAGDENLPGQTVIQVDDQLIDVPDEGTSIFQVNSQPMVAVNDQDQENMFKNQPVTSDIGDAELVENVGAMRMAPSENLMVNPQVMIDQPGQNSGVSADMPILKSQSPVSSKSPLQPSYSFKKEQEFRSPKIIYAGNKALQRSSVTVKPEIESEFPTPNISPSKNHPFAPTFEGFQAAKLIQTEEQGSERSSETSEGKAEMSPTEKTMKVVGDKDMEMVGDKHMQYENAIEKKIEKLITPREQEFLHNFGKIVPSIEKMHLNSKSDIYFMGNGIKLPLKMLPNNDGSISLSVDLEKLCKCKNSTCSHKIDMINKLDGNLADLSNNYENSEVSASGKHENDITLNMENHSEKKIRKPRNHIDLSKLYKNYRKKYHRLHRRSVSNEYFKRFKEIEQGLENKLDELNENVKKSNREYDNMLQKGTKNLLQIKEEDQVVKQRIELVNDLLKWMKEMASEITNTDMNKQNLQF